MKLSRLNAEGIAEFRTVLNLFRDGHRIDAPLALLSDPKYSEPVADVEVTATVYETRGEMAASLGSLVSKASLSNEMSDHGLWAWLSAAHIDTVCPIANGVRNPQNDYRHIPSADWRHFYRHLIRGPVRIYRLFQEAPTAAAIVLCQHPSAPGDFVEQLASRQERITNPSIIEAANRLYYDLHAQRPKRGAATNWRKPGTLRRFGDLLDQLDLTYDLYSMSADDLLLTLPEEFAPYRDG